MGETRNHGYIQKGLSVFCRLLIAVVLIVLSGTHSQVDAAKTLAGPDNVIHTGIEERFDRIPLYFVENRGQMDSKVFYYVQGRDKTVYFTSQGLTLILSGKGDPISSHDTRIRRASHGLTNDQSDVTHRLRPWVVKLNFVGANPGVKPEGLRPTDAVFSYFRGSRDRWKTGLRTYGSVIYRDLWPGIDLIYTGTVNRLKYRFVVKPGADPERIRLAYRGVSSLGVNGEGQLEVNTPVGGFSDDRPTSYQVINGQPVEVLTAYTLKPDASKNAKTYGFKAGPYDNRIPLIVDPAMLVYCGYIGGSMDDGGGPIALDGDGNAYITGSTRSTSATFPVSTGPDLSHNGNTDAYVAKINASGTGLVYCGYIGGSGNETGNGIAVSSYKEVYITGITDSTEATFPVNVGPDVTHNGDRDAFVAKINASGTDLVYCGYIGGSDYDSGNDIAIDRHGDLAYVTGRADSTEATFPVKVGPDVTHNKNSDAFVAMVNMSGTTLGYCGYVGGVSYDWGRGIAVDNDKNAYITGQTASTEVSFPVKVGPDGTHNGGYDTFVARVSVFGTALDYCGYIGGSGYDVGHDIAVDNDGNVYVAGETDSTETSFPVNVGPDVSHNGYNDAFVAKVEAMTTTLDYCGYIGGDGADFGYAIAVDRDGNAYVTGYTDSSDATFPVINGPDVTHNGGCDAFVGRVKVSGTAFDYCGYIGGRSWDSGYGIAVDGDGNAYVAGSTMSTESTFPVSVGPALSHSGFFDAFVAKIVPDLCLCDLNHDGSCDILDWPYFIEDWGRTDCNDPGVDCECDLNYDGSCNILDWPYFIQDWGRTDCPVP